MGVIIKYCKTVDAEVGVCPLKTAYRKYCLIADSCNIKRSKKGTASYRKITPICHVSDCFNNFDGKCDVQCEIDSKGLCMIYQFSRERFNDSLKKTVEGIIK